MTLAPPKYFANLSLMAARKRSVFRKYCSGFCTALISHPAVCITTTLQLYSKEYISKQVKDDVVLHSRGAMNMQVAAAIQNCLAVKLQIDPDCWDGMMQVLCDECEPLLPVIQNMRRDVSLSNSSTAIEDNQTQKQSMHMSILYYS